ncbi:MAG: hypothetical protein CM15mP103_06480 [Gammaproteobacteria bacterium]|nr:MAG: hypothetical protein CM15mP103_06480 [Gammaproteobacteria bacterium]
MHWEPNRGPRRILLRSLVTLDLSRLQQYSAPLAETGAEVTWRPFLVGGVFNAVNPSVYQARAEPMDPKIVHNYRWLHEWAQVAGLPLVFPTAHHPVKSVLAMRACCVLEQDQPALQHFSKAAFDAYFARGENIDEPDVIQAIAMTVVLMVRH